MKNLTEKFLRYIKIDTQSQHYVDDFPSTKKQLDLSKLLFEELKAMGASDVEMSQHGYVYATIPSNCNSKLTLGFVAHVDTADAVSGANVNPQIFQNYDGGDIVLKDDCVLSVAEFPELANHVGKTIATADGTTLLGADDKAGVAAIMTLAETLLSKPNFKHCNVKIAFTPDEEVGRGTDFFDLSKFKCDGAYTVDGEKLGQLQYENFNAAAGEVQAFGKSVHPGTAKHKMVNALLLLMEFHGMLPVFDNPMYTENYEGFFHLDSLSGSVDYAKSNYIIRDHDKQKFEKKKQYFQQCCDLLNMKCGFEAVKCTVKDSYYNMAGKLASHMWLVDRAKEAMKKVNVEPIVEPIRGGTDGAVLSWKGLPCPNIFTGGYNFHGRFEYIPLEDLQKAFEVILELVKE